MLWHYNFISLHSICEKLCLLGCSILPIKFSKISNFMKYTQNNSNTLFFTYFLHNWEFTFRVFSLFVICCKKAFNCCLLFTLLLRFVYVWKKETLSLEIIVIMLIYLLLTNSVIFVEWFSSQGCFQTKWEAVYVPDAQTRFVQKILLSMFLFLVIRSHLINYEVCYVRGN